MCNGLNHALADYGDPGHTLHQIGCGRLLFDVDRIQAAAASPQSWRPSRIVGGTPAGVLEAALLERWRDAFAHLDARRLYPGYTEQSHHVAVTTAAAVARLQRVVNRLPGWPCK